MNTTSIIQFAVSIENGVVKKIGKSIGVFPGKKFKDNEQEEHPKICYVYIEVDHSVGIIKWGEHGYYKTDWPNNFTPELVTNLNAKIGVNEKQAAAMKLCSMNKAISTPAEWYEKYCYLLKRLAERKNNR